MPAGSVGLYARLTPRMHLEYQAGLSLLSRRARGAAVERELRRFALGPIARRRTDRLSMGQRQRVRLATTFLHSPRVVLLDEPDSSLDDDAIALLRTALDAHREGGGSSVWCTPTAPPAATTVDVSLQIVDGLVVPL